MFIIELLGVGVASNALIPPSPHPNRSETVHAVTSDSRGVKPIDKSNTISGQSPFSLQTHRTSLFILPLERIFSQTD